MSAQGQQTGLRASTIVVSLVLALLGTAVLTTPAAAAGPPADHHPLRPHGQLVEHRFARGVFRAPADLEFATDRVLVRFKPGRSSNDLAQARQSIQASEHRTYHLVPGMQLLKIPPSRNVLDAVDALSRNPNVEYASLDFSYRVEALPDDTDFGDQWALPQINAPSAWDRTTGSSSVIVAVLDTGVDLTHPDLVANLVPGWNFVADNDTPSDDNSHGTHVAGIIGAVGNNALGVTGVNWSVGLMPLKICDQYGLCSLSDEIAALEFAVDHGADVANASFGGPYGGWQPERDAIEAAGNAGLVYVAGAGNSAANNDVLGFYPSGYDLDNVIAVAASTPADELSTYSNHGIGAVDLAAPGDGILSTVPAGYGALNGTSMATPFVSGAAALVRALHPTWTAQRIRRRLLMTADPVSSLAGKVATCGRLNVGAATDPGVTVRAALCVSRRGTGLGQVTSLPAGIDCGDVCAAPYAVNTQVTLAATPSTGASFAGWTGACSGTGSCIVALSETRSVTAVFRDTAPQSGWRTSPLAAPAEREAVTPGSRTNRYESFFNVSLSANGKVRAKTIFNAPNGWCYYETTDTGGIYLERKTKTGWKSDGVITAPWLGPLPADRWMNCDDFGAVTKLSADGSTLLVVQAGGCVSLVYRRGQTGWTLDSTLVSGGYGWCGWYGYDGGVSTDGLRVAIYGHQFTSDGTTPSRLRVDVFVRTSTGWALEKKILGPTGGGCAAWPGERRLAMSGDGTRILLGDPSCSSGDHASVGRLYFFSRSGSTWSRIQTLASPEGLNGSAFGLSVAISANGLTATIGVQASSGTEFKPLSWVYELVEGKWLKRTRLAPLQPDPESSFACASIVRAGSRIVCASFETLGFNTAQGALYIFDRPATGWSAGARLTRVFVPDGFAFDRLGASGRFWLPQFGVREDGLIIDIPIAAYNNISGAYPNDRIGYEFRR